MAVNNSNNGKDPFDSLYFKNHIRSSKDHKFDIKKIALFISSVCFISILVLAITHLVKSSKEVTPSHNNENITNNIIQTTTVRTTNHSYKTPTDKITETTSINDSENTYWVIFEEGSRDNRIEMSKAPVTGDAKIIFDGKSLRVDQDTICYQYYYNSNTNDWEEIGTYHCISDYANLIIASNVDIYDENGNLFFGKNLDNYSNFDVFLSEIHNNETLTESSVRIISDFSTLTKNAYASSQLANQTYGNKTYEYSPNKVLDNDPTTCWSEGAADNGEGEQIEIVFDNTYAINKLYIMNGLCTSEDLFYKNSRLREFSVSFSNGLRLNYECSDGWNHCETTFDLPEAIETSSIIITIESVYPGEKYNDTCISEISIS